MGAAKGNHNSLGNPGNPNPRTDQLKKFTKGHTQRCQAPRAGLKSRNDLLRITLSMMSEDEWQEWFRHMKTKEPKAFLSYISHVLPKENTTHIDGQLTITFEQELEKMRQIRSGQAGGQ